MTSRPPGSDQPASPVPASPGEEDRFRAAWEAASDAMALSNPDGIVVDANPAYFQLYGYEPQDIIGQSFAIIFPEDIRDWAEEQHRLTFTQPEITPTVATTIQRKDGVQRRVEVRYTFLTDATGQRTALLSVIRDVTTQQLAQEALRASEARLRAAEAHYRGVFEGVEECILVANAQGRLRDVNPAAARLLGDERSALLGMRIAAVLGDPVAASAIDAALNTDGAWRGEAELRRANGRTVPIEGQAVLIPTPDGPQRILVARDITERRALEQQQRAFLEMIGHDLKTPLTSIRGLVQLMQRRSAYSHHTTDTILEQTNRLTRLINDLLDLARLDARQLEVRHAEVALNSLVAQAVENARMLAQKHTLELTMPDDTVRVWGDPDRLLQVLNNLLANAIKYSPSDGTVAVRLERAGDAARVTVQDDGPGLAPATQTRLFERFYRTVAARQQGTPGSGLGLAICKGIVEAHGGQIGVESAPGHGSSFWFTLPGA